MLEILIIHGIPYTLKHSWLVRILVAIYNFVIKFSCDCIDQSVFYIYIYIKYIQYITTVLFSSVF